MKKYYLCAAVAILCWSSVATITKLMLSTLNSWQVLFISSFFAGLALFFFNLTNKKLPLLKNCLRRKVP